MKRQQPFSFFDNNLQRLTNVINKLIILTVKEMSDSLFDLGFNLDKDGLFPGLTGEEKKRVAKWRHKGIHFRSRGIFACVRFYCGVNVFLKAGRPTCFQIRRFFDYCWIDDFIFRVLYKERCFEKAGTGFDGKRDKMDPGVAAT